MKILKYTPYNIKQLVINKINDSGGKSEICKKLNLKEDEVEIFYEDFTYLNKNMFKMASKILDKSIDNLTQFTEVNQDTINLVKCRDSIGDSPKKEKAIEDSLSLFVNMINMIKISEGVH